MLGAAATVQSLQMDWRSAGAGWRCGNHRDWQHYPGASVPEGGSNLPSLLHGRGVPAQDSPGLAPAPHGSGVCEKMTCSGLLRHPALLMFSEEHALAEPQLKSRINDALSPRQALRAGETHCPGGWAPLPATLLAMVKEPRSPCHQLTQFVASQKAREAWGPLQEEAA